MSFSDLGLAVAAIALASCGEARPPTPSTPYLIWSDEAVLAYARAPWTQGKVSSAVLGKHRGVRLVQEVDCSDDCPYNTARFLRYDLASGLTCDQAHGKLQSVRVPRAMTLETLEFCMPAILVDHWDEVRPMIGFGSE